MNRLGCFVVVVVAIVLVADVIVAIGYCINSITFAPKKFEWHISTVFFPFFRSVSMVLPTH